MFGNHHTHKRRGSASETGLPTDCPLAHILEGIGLTYIPSRNAKLDYCGGTGLVVEMRGDYADNKEYFTTLDRVLYFMLYIRTSNPCGVLAALERNREKLAGCFGVLNFTVQSFAAPSGTQGSGTNAPFLEQDFQLVNGKVGNLAALMAAARASQSSLANNNDKEKGPNVQLVNGKVGDRAAMMASSRASRSSLTNNNDKGKGPNEQASVQKKRKLSEKEQEWASKGQELVQRVRDLAAKEQEWAREKQEWAREKQEMMVDSRRKDEQLVEWAREKQEMMEHSRRKDEQLVALGQENIDLKRRMDDMKEKMSAVAQELLSLATRK